MATYDSGIFIYGNDPSTDSIVTREYKNFFRSVIARFL